MFKKQEPENIPAVVGGKTTNINEVKTTLDSKNISNEKKFNLLEQVLSDPYLDKHERLDLGIRYLNNLKNPEVNEYISVSKEIMRKLHNAFQGDELYKPWVRYFDVSCKVAEESIKESERSIFTNCISTLVQELLFENGNDQVDWRMIKKMLEVRDILFEEDTIDISQQEDLFKPIKIGIEKAIEFLLWKDPNITVDSTKLTTNTLKILKDHFSNQSKFNQLKEAILSSRFDKDEFKLTNTVIMGEDGGMYLLLNNLNGNEQIIKEVVSDDYLKDKLLQKEEKQQITIGKGGFGTVRFALSLFDAKSKPGDLICIKKTKSINYPEPSYEKIIDATLRDYFTNDIANIIYAPDVFDMALVTDRETENNHRKGYLMMKVLPQNTATKVFKYKKYQKWEYQKPYLLDVFQKILDLLGQNIVMTDLKPDNTLYDTDTRKATIIDLGGRVRVENKAEIAKFNIGKYSFQSTKEFSAEELQEKKEKIDISKALAFACGKVIEDIIAVGQGITDLTHRTPDERISIIKGGTGLEEEEARKVDQIITNLAHKTPGDRISIEETRTKIEAIGDDSYKENIIFTHYISKIKERLKNKKSSISINEDIEKLISNQEARELVSNQNIENTESLYIDIYTTKLDPYRYANLTTDILSKKIDDFLDNKKDEQKEVMLLLGVAGAGKSITLQLKFIEAVKNWKVGNPLPIYFNLASNIDLVKIMDSLNNELGTNLNLNDLKNAHLYIDSFDEGLGIATEREILVRSYIEKLENSKILISCRTDYLPGNNDYNWFMPKSKQLEVYYIAPINYSEEQKLEKYISNYVQYVTKYSDKTYNNEETRDTEYYLKKIAKLKIAPIIDTGFMFEIVMQTIPSIHVSSTIERPISRQDIYDEYLKIKQGNRIADLHERQKDKIEELLSNLNIDHNENTQELELNQRLKELGKYIATSIHLQNVFRIRDTNELFKAFEYEDSTLFKQQALYHILKLLPLKIETKTLVSKVKIEQEVEIGFAHVIFKNYYLFEVIKDEVKKSGKSTILANHSIVKDVELIKLIAEDIVYDKNLQKFLRQAIDGTKQDKSDEAVTFASNSITLLIAAQYSFSGEDLSNIAIRGANIRNGIFQYVDFSNADLTGVNLTNANLVAAKFIGTNMQGIKLSIYPDLTHDSPVNCVNYSPDGKYLATFCLNGITKLLDVTNGKVHQGQIELNGAKIMSCSPDGQYLALGYNNGIVSIRAVDNAKILQNLEGHTSSVLCISYSPNGENLASCSWDGTVKIWDIESGSGKTLQNLAEHSDKITCVSYSPDGQYLALGYDNGIVSIRAVHDAKILQNLEGHTSSVLCISYSPNEENLASCSWDETVKIWDINSGKILQNLAGNSDKIACVSYSPDGQYLALGFMETVSIQVVDDAKLLQNLEGHTNDVLCISYSPAPNKKYLASGSTDKSVKIWDIKDGKLLQNLEGHTDDVLCISYSPNGENLASCSWDGTVKIWDIESGSGKTLQNLAEHSDKIICVSYSPDGKYLALGSINGTISIWDFDAKISRSQKGHTSDVLCISYSHDGQQFATCSLDMRVKIWDINFQNLKEYYKDALYLSYSPDGKYLALGFLDRAVEILDINDSQSCKTLAGCRDGKYFDSCSWSKVVEPNDGKVGQTLAGYTDKAICVSYSPDGEYLALASWDKTVKVWDVNNDKILQNLAGHIDKVTCISYSPNGNYFTSGSLDKTIKIWGRKINPQTNKVVWYLIKEISATESPLVAEDATIKEAVISAKNQAVFEQKGAKVIDNIIDNTENKEVDSKEVVIPKKTVNKEPNALLKGKLELAAKQETLKLVKVKSKFIKEPIKVDISTQNDYTSVNALMGIKYDNPLLNNPMLLKKLASNLNININQAIDASNHCTNLFGNKDFNYICNSDQNLLQELLGNYCEY